MRRLLLAAAVAALSTAAPAAAADVSYRLTMAPREVLFGDPMRAEVDVVVDPARVDPRTVRVHADFRPYETRATTVTRRAAGDLVRVVFAYRLDCLERKCLPGGPEKRVSFRPVRITWENQTQTEFWPPLQLASRIEPRELLQPQLRSDVIRQPAITYRVSPSALALALVALAGLLLLYPAMLAIRGLQRAWYVWRTTRLERMTPIERALELLRAAAAGGEHAPRRRALERVARELGDHELVQDARRLAWSRPRPESEEMDSLRSRVEDP